MFASTLFGGRVDNIANRKQAWQLLQLTFEMLMSHHCPAMNCNEIWEMLGIINFSLH